MENKSIELHKSREKYLLNKIERMKCCGNCLFYDDGKGGLNCIDHFNGTDKCGNWKTINKNKMSVQCEICEKWHVVNYKVHANKWPDQWKCSNCGHNHDLEVEE